MDDRVQMIIIAWLVFASLYTDAAIADERRDLTTQNPGILNIDCGVDEDYFDETAGLHYKSDKGFVSTGENGVVSPEFEDNDIYNVNYTRLTKNLRYFPKGRKNCYTLKPYQGKNNNYMIQVLFKYGNYDGLNQTRNFDLFLGVHYWSTIHITNVSWFYRTAFYFSPKDFFLVCLVNTGHGTPFISALQVRPISNSIYRTDSGFAKHFRSFDVGNPNNTFVRYKDDFYDRIWQGYMPGDWDLLDNTQSLHNQNSDDTYRIPSEVWRTAVQLQHNRASLTYNSTYDDSSSSFNICFYFAEVLRIPEGQKREFNIDLNGVQHGPITTQYWKLQTVICYKAQSPDRVIQFSIYRTANSDLPPILNGFEILIDKITNASETNPVDVDAIMAIQKIYSIDRPGWQGDPCEPKAFPWEGLNCSDVNNTTRITSLNLASSELYGLIASEFFNLKELQSLDLSDNKLTGPVPEFLAELPNLVTLDISGNQLTGPLPQSLVEKSKNGTLKLSFGLKPNPCSSGSCDKKKRKVLIPMVVSIIVFLALLVILCIFSRIKRHGVVGTQNGSIFISRNRSFTYSEIVNMTGNFANIIGEGGFGKVYHGELNDGTQVAVKLLSHSSKQGFKEFLSEVQLLLMVYHRNLVSLIGYCEEHRTLALVYEYMGNGSLRKLLSDKSSYVLNWRERLQIALDAARGLEYLHNGCKPPIVHRDLKTSNILIDEHLIAKISDFGLSRVFANDRDTHVTTNPAGTLGYVDPELNITGNSNKKSDVYSFGIILFELITGQPAVIRGVDYNVHILQWVTPMIEAGDIHSIVDQRLEGEFNTNSAWKIVEAAMSCIPTTAIQRPDMGHVLVELQECLATDMVLGGSQTFRSVRSVTKSSNALQMSSVDVDAQFHPRVR